MKGVIVVGTVVLMLGLVAFPAGAAAEDIVPGCHGVELDFCSAQDSEEVASECRWREEVEGWPGAVEVDGRTIPAVALCWEVHAALRARERPQEELEEHRAREVRRERERERREWAHKPTVNARKANLLVEQRLRREVEGWKHRTAGSVDCRGGRVDRTHWRCKVRWLYRVPGGERCRVGRFKVRGEGYRNGVAWYSTAGQWVNGYGFLDGGRIRCYA